MESGPEKTEEIYRDGGRRTSGVIVAYFVAKLISCNSFIDTTQAVHQNGVGGAYFSAIAACVATTLAAPLTLELKTKAPGARTFLQVVRTRFGTPVHCLFCVCALLVNLGMSFEICSRSLTALIQISPNVSKELILAVIIFTVGVILGFGGISSLFSSSYVTTAFLVSIVVLTGDAIFFNSGLYPLGDCERLIALTACQRVRNSTTPALSFRSLPAIFHALKKFDDYLVLLLLDQSFWQGVLSSEPETSGFNLVASGLFFFPVGAVFGTACGLGYLALNMSYGQVMLSNLMERLGLIVYAVLEFLFGRFGFVLFNTVIICTVTTCICSEVMAISSIFVVDVYMTYIRPFKKTEEVNNCVLCGLRRGRCCENRERCRCKSMAACFYCQRDEKDHQFARKRVPFRSACPTHGQYRQYIQHTRNVRNYAVYTVLAVFLFGPILLDLVEVSLIDICHYVSALCGPLLGSLYFAFYWARVTPAAVFAGFVVGTLCGIGIIVAPFTIDWVWLNGASPGTILVGAVVTTLFTLITTQPLSEEEELEVWERTRAIDDPLQPWSEGYGRDLGIRNAHLLTEGQPRLDDVKRAFSFSSKILKYASLLLLILYLGVLPAFVLIPAELSPDHFQAFVFILLTWLSTALMFLLIIPPVFALEKARHVKKERKASQYIRRHQATIRSQSHYLLITKAYFRSVKERITRALPLTKKNN
ncbi:solute symporter family transporter [Echinococcus multilocularis]|uniref:Solute symporter family transporter n=1 Tax=Echinococcus multilocularis TaxID=6211 RepID=A0A087VZJ7_ECHMU|nr:solute symporter family transporter [Echinococcus multilocularis]